MGGLAQHMATIAALWFDRSNMGKSGRRDPGLGTMATSDFNGMFDPVFDSCLCCSSSSEALRWLAMLFPPPV
jgi:hypothetical protein